MNNKKKKITFKIIGSSYILMTVSIMVVLICVLIIFNFFGAKLTKDKVDNNEEYADAYIDVANKYLKDGYVPLQRILYFYLEDTSLTFDTLYTINQNKEQKTSREIKSVCEDERVKNMVACTQSNIKENEEYLIVSNARFNFPLDVSSYTVTSFFNEQRTIYEKSNVHNGWDFAVPAQTPVYSTCSGTVVNVNYTQDENIPFEESGNNVGNTITIQCDEDYDEIYYVVFEHLYPNSAKVSIGDNVNHWTEIASVGTTGYSTGNHLHYQVETATREKIDGMKFIDFNLTKEA